MAIIIRNRTIRPSSRLETSKSYKIDTKIVSSGDTLDVNIDHESKPFFKSYTFNGADVKNKNSISFRVYDNGTKIDIIWSGATPANSTKTQKISKPEAAKTVNSLNQLTEGTQIMGLPPIVNESSKILILGTMPGAESLRKQEYYGKTGNLFWKLVSEITSSPVGSNYEDKKMQLLKNNIAIWDMCKACIRPGSLDSNISNEIPNDIVTFINDHPTIHAIAFNGKEAAKLFAKYFKSIPGIKLISLPSTSPANAGISWEIKIKEWSKLNTLI